MRFVDELYSLYREQIQGEELDAEIITATILDDLDRDDIMSLIGEFDDNELYGLFGYYLAENLKVKMVKEGLLNKNTSLH